MRHHTELGYEVADHKSFVRRFHEHKRKRRAKYFWSILANLLLLYIFNSIPNLHVFFITDKFLQVLPIFNVAIVAALVGNIILIMEDRYGLEELIHLLLNFIGLFVLHMMIVVFPFDFDGNAWFATLVMVALWVGLFGEIIAIIIDSWKFLFRLLTDLTWMRSLR